MKLVEEQQREDELKKKYGNVYLLPCPFCGGKAFIEWPGKSTRTLQPITLVGCMECTASVLSEDTEKAIKLWNSRSTKELIKK
ncbi:Lar family restriction alleviation protein [Megasphaera sueciensis]|uniref:Lar family restriction alleviation protein n=1 Tax=Megasphaera sueciensis TaxID=349094 RepID=UPI003D03AFF8